MKRALLAIPLAVVAAAALAMGARPEGITARPLRKLRPAAETPERAPAPLGPEAVARIFETPVKEDTVVDRLRRALEAMSEEDLALARVKLAKFLEENPGEIGGLLSEFERESEPDLLLLLAETIGGDAAAMENPLVADLMIRLAGASDLPERRGAALLVLARLPRPDPRAVETVLRIARDEAPRGVRIDALGAATAWMQRFPDQAGPLSGALAAMAVEIRDDDVRGHAIQAVALLDRAPEAEVVGAMARLLSDPVPQNRSLAAMALGNAPAGARMLEGAIASEGATETGRGMLIHLVRAAGPGAPEVLARLAERDARFVPDVRDYLELLKTERDPARLWERKQERELSRGQVTGADDHHD